MIKREQFGVWQGSPVYKYVLQDKIEAEIVTFGGTLVSLKVPNAQGGLTDVSLGYSCVEQMWQSTAYLGATIGRCGNRIADGKFVLDGKTYLLAKNDGENHLHGGTQGFNKRLFDAEVNGNGVTMSLHSADGEENYPGDLDFSVKFTVEGTTFTIEYFGKCGANTLFNPTNHAYFNLDGDGDVHQNVLQIFASKYLPVDSSLIPTGEERCVAGSAFDFTQPKPIGKDVCAKDEQLALAGGYDHNFCLDGAHAARAFSPKTGIVLDCFTDRCGLQFYSGNFLNEQAKKYYPKRSGFCLETQCYPNAINQSEWLQPVLKKGENFYSKTQYVFSVGKI